jgi:ankyrin repeat protein
VARCDVNMANSSGQTAVMMASLFGHGDIVQLLADRGARLALTDAAGNTAASLAHQQGNTAVEALLAKLADGPARAPE